MEAEAKQENTHEISSTERYANYIDRRAERKLSRHDDEG